MVPVRSVVVMGALHLTHFERPATGGDFSRHQLPVVDEKDLLAVSPPAQTKRASGKRDRALDLDAEAPQLPPEYWPKAVNR